MDEAAMEDGGADADQNGIGSTGGLGLRKGDDDDDGVVVSRIFYIFL
jgi:hypothetical protein